MLSEMVGVYHSVIEISFNTAFFALKLTVSSVSAEFLNAQFKEAKYVYSALHFTAESKTNDIFNPHRTKHSACYITQRPMDIKFRKLCRGLETIICCTDSSVDGCLSS